VAEAKETNAQCTVCWERMYVPDQAAAEKHIEERHPYLLDADPLDQFSGLDGRPLPLAKEPRSRTKTARNPAKKPESESLGGKAAGVAITAGVGVVKLLKWWLSGSEIGPKERGDEQMGRNYDPHDGGGYFVKDDDGNLQPYDADTHGLYVKDGHGNLRPYNR
jgi:hypothetical protein